MPTPPQQVHQIHGSPAVDGCSSRGAVGRWFITPHAVRAYQRRINRRASYGDALTALVLHSQKAHFVKKLSGSVEYWRAGRPTRLRFRVAAPPRAGMKPALVTVLAGWGRCNK